MEKREQRDRRHASRTLLARARHQQRLAGNHRLSVAAQVQSAPGDDRGIRCSAGARARNMRPVDRYRRRAFDPAQARRQRQGGPEPNKIMIGRSLGLPIVLGQPNDLLALAITEGVEDGLALHQALGMGAWAAGAAGRMPALAEAIPTYIEAVTIELHPDSGRRFAEQLAQTLSDRGVDVFTREAVA